MLKSPHEENVHLLISNNIPLIGSAFHCNYIFITLFMPYNLKKITSAVSLIQELNLHLSAN